MATIATFIANLKIALADYYSSWRVVDVAEGEPSKNKTIVLRPASQDVTWTGIDTCDGTYHVQAIFWSRTLADITGVDLAGFVLAHPEVGNGYRIRIEQPAVYASGLEKQDYAHELQVTFTADSR